MRWLKAYRTDLESPAFVAGVRKFGKGFIFDLLSVWAALMQEDGPGVRELVLTEEIAAWLSGRIGETEDGLMDRLFFMAEWRLVGLKERRVGRRSGRLRAGWNRKAAGSEQASRGSSGGSGPAPDEPSGGKEAVLDRQPGGTGPAKGRLLVVSSAELIRRRDEWSRRLSKKTKQNDD